MTRFNNRVYGLAIVRVVNANLNADFTGQPRTLPSGRVYASDKSLKHSIRYYLNDVYKNEEKVFYIKTLNENLNPRTLDERYTQKGFIGGKGGDTKKEAAKNLLTCIDVRLFGATFASKKVDNLSFHGPVQVEHAINVWHEYSPLRYNEQITSPFRNPKEKKGKEEDVDKDNEREMTTIGRQSKLEEGHYFYPFTINPDNLSEINDVLDEKDAHWLSTDDVDKLKEAMQKCVSWYDSASKIGCENELLIWITLREGSHLIMPSLSRLISLEEEKKDGICEYNLGKLKTFIQNHREAVESVDVLYDSTSCKVKNEPEECQLADFWA